MLLNETVIHYNIYQRAFTFPYFARSSTTISCFSPNWHTLFKEPFLKKSKLVNKRRHLNCSVTNWPSLVVMNDSYVPSSWVDILAPSHFSVYYWWLFSARR